MERSKCPVCGKQLRHRARRCRECGAELVICSECGSAYKKGTISCDMCGRELKRKRFKLPKKELIRDEQAPNDLVSIINNIKRKGIGYKFIRALRLILGVLFCISLAITAVIGFLAGDAMTDTVVLLLRGSIPMSEIGTYLLNTPVRNFRIWTDFIGDLSKNDATVGVILEFFDYFVSSLFLPMLTVTVFYCLLYLPLDIVEKLFCGIAARKKGYNASDTVAVFERPTLVYNSKDSFNKAYTYFPFIERTRGTLAAVTADVLFYAANLFCCASALAVLVAYTVIKIVARLILGAVAASITEILIVMAAFIAVSSYVLSVVAVCLAVNLIIRAIRRKQLKNFSI